MTKPRRSGRPATTKANQHGDGFHLLGWAEAIESAEERGKPELLIAQLRSTAVLDEPVREMLADLFERRRLKPKLRVSDDDISLLVAAEEFRTLHPNSQIRKGTIGTGRRTSMVRDEYIERVANEYKVRPTALRHFLAGTSTAWKRLKKYRKNQD